MTAPAAPQVTVRRLTVGWRDRDDPALLATHQARYGPMPSPGPAAGLIEAVTQAGLTGRGGAGFPTGTKMAAVASGKGPAVVVANGMDSEPASEKDEALLSRAPHLVLDGAALAAASVGASQVLICLPRFKNSLIGLVQRAVAERTSAGIDQVAITVHDPPGGYVSSSETALVNWLNGNEAKPTATPPRPFQRGVDRRPTLISNVETFAHVGLIARFGPAWFRQAGPPEAPGSMLVTVSGAVATPGVFEVAGGTPVGAAVGLAGPDERAGSVLIGGYFGSWNKIARVGQLPLAQSALRPVGAAPGAGVLVVLPHDACGLAETARILAWLAGQSAGQCGPCRFGLPAIADDFARLASGRPEGSLLDRLERRLGQVKGRGACAHPDGAVRLASSALSAFAPDVQAHAASSPCLHVSPGSVPCPVLPIPAYAGTEAR
jgi:NADH:ubiquinone oxidoreductase subunit F (NADH-binding)